MTEIMTKKETFDFQYSIKYLFFFKTCQVLTIPKTLDRLLKQFLC